MYNKYLKFKTRIEKSNALPSHSLKMHFKRYQTRKVMFGFSFYAFCDPNRLSSLFKEQKNREENTKEDRPYGDVD